MSPQNNGYSKNLCILKKALRLGALGVRFYINYSVTYLFDATMPEKSLGQKKFSQSTQRRKDIKEYKVYKKNRSVCFDVLTNWR